MATGEGALGLGLRQQERIEAAIEACRSQNGLDVSVVVGDLELDEPGQFRAAAERLHAALGADRSGRADHAVLVVVAIVIAVSEVVVMAIVLVVAVDVATAVVAVAVHAVAVVAVVLALGVVVVAAARVDTHLPRKTPTHLF